MKAKSPALMATLRNCPTHYASVSREMYLESWAELQREEITPFSKPTIPVMAALLLYDDRFTGLLNAAEQAKLRSLVQFALDRYEQQINPPNQLGRRLAGLINKE